MSGTEAEPAGAGGAVSGGPEIDPAMYGDPSNWRQTSPFGITTSKVPTRKDAVREKLQLWVDERQAQLWVQGLSQEPYILKQVAYKRKIQEEHDERVATSSMH